MILILEKITLITENTPDACGEGKNLGLLQQNIEFPNVLKTIELFNRRRSWIIKIATFYRQHLEF